MQIALGSVGCEIAKAELSFIALCDGRQQNLNDLSFIACCDANLDKQLPVALSLVLFG